MRRIEDICLRYGKAHTEVGKINSKISYSQSAENKYYRLISLRGNSSKLQSGISCPYSLIRIKFTLADSYMSNEMEKIPLK